MDTDNNYATGCLSDGGAEAVIGFGIHTENGNYYTYSQYFTNPTEIESPENERYQNQVFNIQPQYGGPGQDYQIMVVPLSELSIEYGHTITIYGWAESGSENYHHASFDLLCPASQTPILPDRCPVQVRMGLPANIH